MGKLSPLMRDWRRSVKAFLNEQASSRLAQLGHSPAMIRDAKREAWWWLQARGVAVRRRTRLLSGQAVVWTAPGVAELVQVEVPRAGDGEVTVEVLTSAVSTGTERAQYLNLPNATVALPHQPGYSAAGVVVAIGPNVSDVRVGELVGVRNVPHMSLVTVPSSSVHSAPLGVPEEGVAMVQLGVICGQGVRRANVKPGEDVCVIGAGLVGALAQRLMVARGAGSVTVVARSRVKEALVHSGGAARFIAVEEEREAVAAIASPVVIEATGDPEALELAVEAAADRGRVVLLGSPRGVTADAPLAAIRAKGVRVIGAHVNTLTHESRVTGVDTVRREARAFLDVLASRRMSVTDLVEEAIDPREADAFYRRLAHDREIVGACFDWTLLPADDRIRDGRFLRLPNLGGRGADVTRRPLPPDLRGRRSGLFEHADPFAGASGRLRIGLLGCGDIAVQNAAAIQVAPNVELVACYDPVSALAEDIARAHGAELAPTSDELLNDDSVDAVLLSVPHDLHVPLGKAAVAAGKHVVVEKPLANNLSAAAELVHAAERSGVVLSVCFPHRYRPDVVVAKRLIQRGAIGELAGLLLNFFMDKPASYWFGGFSGRASSNWRGSRERAGGGVLIMNLSHYLDLIRYLTGVEPDVVAARTQTADPWAEVEDAAAVNVDYANGALGSLFANARLPGTDPTVGLRLWGADGHIVLEPDPRIYTLRALNGLRTNRWQTFGRLPPTNIRAVYFSRLGTTIDREEPPDITGEDGLAAQAFIEAAYRSSECGRDVKMAAVLQELEV
jgi:predicted dehydrogenase/threonine dehydrogenase-like Zn-dependent dehydrogenase